MRRPTHAPVRPSEKGPSTSDDLPCRRFVMTGSQDALSDSTSTRGPSGLAEFLLGDGLRLRPG